MKALHDLYKSHTGKVSDKWLSYLREYDRLFAPYREQPISMLEIGVQNGGSLEIWSEYIPNAHKFVGCDINPDCAKLQFEDTRITVIVGDATDTETQTRVLEQSDTFNLIIEDGSHTSSDIVKAFVKYFPALKTGGIYVAEDLHCSYWQGFEGGIFHPFSSINFFKHLADIVNHEHWGTDKTRTDLMSGFKQLYGIAFDEVLLSQISSVEFINSICVIRKNDQSLNCLGVRVIAGMTESVVGGHLTISGLEIVVPSQALNNWSNLSRPPAEDYQDLIHQIDLSNYLLSQEQKVLVQLRNELQVTIIDVEQLTCNLEKKNLEVSKLNELLTQKQKVLVQLRNDLQVKSSDLEQLTFNLEKKSLENLHLNHTLTLIKQTKSWRYTSWLRFILTGIQRNK